MIDFNATVQDVEVDASGSAINITLDKIPAKSSDRGLEFTVYDNDDSKFGTVTGNLDASTKKVSFYDGNNVTTLGVIRNGTKLQVDNRWYISVHGFHRHQVPTRSGFYPYDYLRDKSGKPRYPQRSAFLGTLNGKGPSAGGTNTGKITTKLLVMDALQDFDAFPWQADWYKNEVKKALGKRFDPNYRLYYSDHGDHYIEAVEAPRSTRIVNTNGIVEQHLRDLSAWTEKGIEPPTPTRYTVEKGQVKVAASASERRGIQPVADLTTGGKKWIKVKAGKPATFQVHIEAPPKTGFIVSTEWDFYGVGEFTQKSFGKIRRVVDTEVTFTYNEPGVYIPAVRVASQRDGDTKTQFAQAFNLGRTRVIVTA